jgi:3-oxoacyl-[acyl-carrier-protein] synthase II
MGFICFKITKNKEFMVLRRVVVTGLGALTPIEITLKNIELLNGVSGAAPITYFDASKFKTQFACELKTLMLRILDRKEARKMDRAQYAMVSSEVNDAGFNLDTLDKDEQELFGVQE